MRLTRQLVFALCICLSASSRWLLAQAPLFVVDAVDGPLPPATLEDLGADWSMQLGGKMPRLLRGSDWIALRREEISLPAFATTNSVLLTTGDRLLLQPGSPVRLDEDRLLLRTNQNVEVTIPLAYLSYLCLKVPQGIDEPDVFLAQLAKAKRPRDVIYLAGGDRVEGTLTSAGGSTLAMQAGDRKVPIDMAQLAIVTVSTELQARPKATKPFVQIVTSGGARLQFSGLRLDRSRGVLMGKTSFGAALQVPLDQVVALTARNARAIYLSDITPKKQDAKPFLGISWPLVADANVMGRQLSLAGNYYDKGLGMHSESQVTYALRRKYRWFEALVGVERGTGVPGEARVSVLVDGRATLPARSLTSRDQPLPLRLDIDNAEEITLRVDYGDFGEVRGRVNWVNARTIEK
jgi:hypothetical protein